MFYQLPPAGNPVRLHACEPAPAMPSFVSGYQTQFYASGTAALAAAIIAVLGDSQKLENNSMAEVLLPAYACPDLVSAVEFAGAKPVLVDFEKNRPWLDLAQLSAAFTVNTIAIVAVNLFGIAERWTQLRELAEKNDVTLIEDSAQYFPGGDEPQAWQGDLVILSFGRGKPVSLLGGGAVLTKKASLFKLLPVAQSVVAGFSQRLLFALKASVYNVMISPFLYWLPQALPFLHLGETRYHKLSAIEALDQVRLDLLTCNIARYQADTERTMRSEKISSMLDSLGSSSERVTNLPRVCGSELNRHLLRYPLLLETASRDRVYQALQQAGLGVSIMYPASLPKIVGLSHIIDDKQCFPNAEEFAARLITLPTHLYATDNNIKKMKAILIETLD